MRKYLFFLMTLLAACGQAIADPVLESVQLIWNQAPYNAFTDLIFFQDKFFCCFRESNSHAGGESGKIRILVSLDALHWESVALLSEAGHDLRDPKFLSLLIHTGNGSTRNLFWEDPIFSFCMMRPCGLLHERSPLMRKLAFWPTCLQKVTRLSLHFPVEVTAAIPAWSTKMASSTSPITPLRQDRPAFTSPL